MSTQLARWTAFDKGDAGWTDKAEIPPGFFQGEQVSLYRDGSVGPRSGVLDLAPTGVPGTGTLHALGYIDKAISATNNWIWIHKGTKLGILPVYDTSGRVLTGQAYIASSGIDFAANPTSEVMDTVDYSPTRTLFTLLGDKAYQVDWSTGAGGTLAALTGSPGGGCIEIFNEFLLIANTVANPNRIYISAAGDFTSWGGGRFFDISGGISGTAGPPISAIRRLRDMLLVWTHLGQLFIVTNITSDDTTTQIRQWLPGEGMSGPQKKAVLRTRDGKAWWTRRDTMPYFGDQAFDFPSAVPVSFDGASRIEYPEIGGYLRQPDSTNDRLSRTSGVAGRAEKRVALFDQAGRVLLGYDGAWTRHNLSASSISGQLLAPGLRGEVFLANSAGTSYSVWQFELDRPPWKFSASATEYLATTPLDRGSALTPSPWFATPQLRPPDGDLLDIDAVEVLFTSHVTRDTTHNTFSVYVQQYDAVDASEPIETGSYFPPDSHTSSGAMVAGNVTVGATAGYDSTPPTTFDLRIRKRFMLPQDQLPCAGARVLLQGLVGVSIHEVRLIGTTRSDARP